MAAPTSPTVPSVLRFALPLSYSIMPSAPSPPPCPFFIFRNSYRVILYFFCSEIGGAGCVGGRDFQKEWLHPPLNPSLPCQPAPSPTTISSALSFRDPRASPYPSISPFSHNPWPLRAKRAVFREKFVFFLMEELAVSLPIASFFIPPNPLILLLFSVDFFKKRLFLEFWRPKSPSFYGSKQSLFPIF